MAQNIFDDAFRNTLHKPGRLARYLNAEPGCINQIGGQHIPQLTPLAAACHQGHLEIVSLLVQHGARPDILCPGGRTALYYAIVQAPRNKVAIIKALLAAPIGPANPNEVYLEDDSANPLTLAIQITQDKDIIQALIDGGATPTAANWRQAKARKLDQYLMSSRTPGAQNLVDLTVDVVSLIIGYADGGAFGSVMKGFLSNMYRITVNPMLVSLDSRACYATTYEQTFKDIPEPKSAGEFKHNIDNFVRTAGLDKFYARNPIFIQSLAEKASALRDDTTTDLGKPENIQRLVQLSLYQLVIYCDDSSSMDYASADPHQSRYGSLCQLVSRIAHVATRILPADAKVQVRFINNHFRGDLTAAEVLPLMHRVRPSGSTPLGEKLVSKVLRPLVYNKIARSDYEFEQPLLICAITDGEPNPGDVPTIRDAVVDCRRALVNRNYDPASVMFCISQVGGDAGGQMFLDQVRHTPEIQDVVYCTTDQLDVKFAELRENERQLEVWLLEMLTKPIMRAVQGP
ncbi:hypothetical protein CVT24_012524 [Panaeolus cyanescens]|uniref:Uncharacterized protein n=1 Tax=Panaeolus cyanescens TaxID=181874 RepID=A0A409YK43_9AGAR|nr:hypothetical protein CVT24_012524 [Panaeolus cyanescens]